MKDKLIILAFAGLILFSLKTKPRKVVTYDFKIDRIYKLTKVDAG